MLFNIQIVCYSLIHAKLRQFLRKLAGGPGWIALPIFLFLAPFFLDASGFRFPLSALRFQIPAFRRFSFLLHAQVSESSSATVRSLLLGFAIAYSTRSQSSGVRWVCCSRELVLVRRRMKWPQTAGRRFFTCDRANLWPDLFTLVHAKPRRWLCVNSED